MTNTKLKSVGGRNLNKGDNIELPKNAENNSLTNAALLKLNNPDRNKNQHILQ